MSIEMSNQGKQNSLQDMMGRMLDLGLFSDLVLVVGLNKFQFNAHKMVLGGRSEVFATMLQSRWMENPSEERLHCHKEEIHLPNYSVESFRIFLRFLYTDKLSDLKNVETALEILELSHFYQVPKLLNEVSRLIQINASNCLEIYKRSRAIDEELSRQSFQFFLKNIRSAAENGQYLSWDAETVRAVLSQNILDIGEVDLFKALLRWGNHMENAEDESAFSRSQAMPELMKMIRFPRMGSQVYASEVVPTGFFSKEETLQMFLHFANPEQTPTSYNSPPRSKIVQGAQLPDFVVYSGTPMTTSNINAQSTTTQQVLELPPEFRLEVSDSISLRGIGIYHHELQGILLNDYTQLKFALTIKDDQGKIIAGKQEVMSASRIVSGINFGSPVILKKKKNYQFFVNCTLNDTQTKRLYPQEDGCVLYRRIVPLGGLTVKSVDFGGGVQGTITFRQQPPPRQSPPQSLVNVVLPLRRVEGLYSTWIHRLLFSNASDGSKPCIIA